MITIAQLVAAGVEPTQARRFADPLSAACALFAIDTPGRKAAFVGQALHETKRFSQLEEGLWYRSPERILEVFKRLQPRGIAFAQTLVGQPQRLANAAYAGVLGNGDEASGDGWRFRGRGVFQLTGRANYEQVATGTGRPYVEQPELVGEPSDACLSAAWYWHRLGLNAFADAWAIDEITRRVNGPAMLAAAERRQFAYEAVRAFA